MTVEIRSSTPTHGAALIILDMMNLFDVDGGRALATQARSISKNILRLRDYLDLVDLPVIYVNDNFMHWKADLREIVTLCMRGGSPGSSIASCLAPAHGHYHIKGVRFIFLEKMNLTP